MHWEFQLSGARGTSSVSDRISAEEESMLLLFSFFAAQSVFPRMVPRTQPELHTRSNVNRDSCTHMHFNMLFTSPTQALPSSLTDINLNI